MWLSTLLLAFFLGGQTRQYEGLVIGLNHMGCQVYNHYWISCQDFNMTPAYGVVPIPEDAIRVVIRTPQASRIN